jgi:caffeoyl-CoA O-methyltransferase
VSVTAPGAARAVTPVGIVAERLAEVLEMLDQQERETAVDPAIRRAVQEAHQLAAGLDPYLERSCGPESPALQALAEVTRRTDWTRHDGSAGGAPLEQEMLSGHVEGQLLQMLVRATRARRVLEIGMFTGYSALALAEAVPVDGSVVACEIDEHAAAIARDAFAASPAGSRIEIRLGAAMDTLHDLARHGDRFDLVFVDADKAGYLAYLDALLELDLLSEGALVCVDNTLMQGQPWTGEPTPHGVAIARFNQAVAEDPRVDQVVVPLRDGLTLLRRRTETEETA